MLQRTAVVIVLSIMIMSISGCITNHNRLKSLVSSSISLRLRKLSAMNMNMSLNKSNSSINSNNDSGNSKNNDNTNNMNEKENNMKKDLSYEYIDSGNRKRLERFGDQLVIRSCPSAIWEKKLSLSNEWDESKNNTIVYEGTSGHVGKWKMNDNAIDTNNWYVKFHDYQLFSLEPSDMGQIGIFPEQEKNWQTIRTLLQKHRASSIESNVTSHTTTCVLNGFAYTGGSTTAALGVERVEVVHLDAAKSAIEWAKRNVAMSNVHPTSKVRWIVDDCMTFLEREIKRNKKYDALIFDPPAFGRGKGGSIWKLDKDMHSLVETFPKLLSDNPCFILLSCHDLYWTPMRLADILQSTLRSSGYKKGRVDCGEMILRSTRGGSSLPLGAFALWSNLSSK